MRSLGIIDNDIEQCKKQISLTYKTELYASLEDAKITREGFQLQLSKLTKERDVSLRQINVVSPIIITQS